MTTTIKPILPGEPMPHRKIMREWLIPLAERTTALAIVMLVVDLVLWGALMAGTVLFESWWAKLLSGCVAGFVIGRLFIIGHDACHQSLTPHRNLNKWLGRIAFLPSLTAYSLWDIGHNVVHHGYTNLKNFDFVWAPYTPEEYAALSTGAKLKDRIYRSGWAPGLYYMIEIWWNKMVFPNEKNMPTRRPIFTKDCLLITAFGAAWVAAMVWAAIATEQNIAYIVLMGVVVPFFFWVTMIGFVVYVHHTHVDVSWHEERTGWSKASPFVSTTVHLTFPFNIGALMHHIMEHTAHHLDMSIPLYKLKQAQNKLEELLPERIIVQPFSWRWYVQTARDCKLYDFKTDSWMTYDGKVTSPRAMKATPAA